MRQVKIEGLRNLVGAGSIKEISLNTDGADWSVQAMPLNGEELVLVAELGAVHKMPRLDAAAAVLHGIGVSECSLRLKGWNPEAGTA